MTAFIVPHDPNWRNEYSREAKAIKEALSPHTITLHHVGSTAIHTIAAKPIIDLMGEVETLDHVDAYNRALKRLGYEILGPLGIKGRHYCRKRNDQGQRTHHLHIFETGSAHVDRHIAFRDYLKTHPELAHQYSDFKIQLAAVTNADWDAYVDGKAGFVAQIERDALAWWKSTNRRHHAQ